MKVKLQNARLSFPDIFVPTQYEGQGPFRYRASFLMEPNSDNHKKLKEAMNAVAQEAWKDKAKKILEAAADDSKLRFLMDGNKKDYDGYGGMIAVSASRDQSKGKPLILDKNPKLPNGDNNELKETDGRPYGGCYVNATIELWPQNNKFGKTIRAQLLAVQFVRDGDAFGASSKGSADDFDDLGDTGDDDLVG